MLGFGIGVIVYLRFSVRLILRSCLSISLVGFFPEPAAARMLSHMPRLDMEPSARLIILAFMAYLRFLDIPACDMAIATACLRLFTTGAFVGPLGLRPAWSVPALYSPMVFATFACLPDLVFGVFMVISFHAFAALATPLFTGQCIG